MSGTIVTSYFANDLHYAITDLWQSVTGLSSNPVSASVTDLGKTSELDVGGEVIRLTKTMVVCASVISAPEIGSLCTIGGNEFMVASISLSADEVSYTIELADTTT